MKNVKVTVPVGVVSPPDTVAESCTVVPNGTDAPLGITLWLASLWIAVTVVVLALSTLNGSQPDGRRHVVGGVAVVGGPERVADPAASGPNVVDGSATPLFSATAPGLGRPHHRCRW